MPRIYLINEEKGMYIFHCPGCGYAHPFHTKPREDGSCWGFNGDLEKPTFSPSLLCNASYPDSRCHLFLRDGVLQFLGDCHHKLAGKNVECPEWEWDDDEEEEEDEEKSDGI